MCCPKLPENVGTLAFATPTFSVSPSEEVSNVTIEDVEQLWVNLSVQWKLDLADTDLAENLDLKDTHQKIFATIFDI